MPVASIYRQDAGCPLTGKMPSYYLIEESTAPKLGMSEPSSRHALDNGPRVINYSRAN